MKTATIPAPRVAARRCACAIVDRGRDGQAYNEEAFHHFLAIERQRERRSGRRSVLCLVALDGDGQRPPVDGRVAARVFRVLWRALRETDVVGWYREGRVMGALLTDVDDDVRPEGLGVVAGRIETALRERLPAHVAGHLTLSLHPNAGSGRLDPMVGA